MWKSLISISLIMSLVFSGSPAWSLTVLPPSEQICFAKPEATKLLTEIKYGQLSLAKLQVCQQSYSTSKQLNINNALLIKGLEKDKVDLRGVADTYKQRYEDTNQRLVESEASKPSRATWFGIGAGTMLVLGILAGFLIKK